MTSTGGIWGYGTVQVRSAENLTFENIDGTGGVSLRLESGGGGLEFIDRIYGRNITCRNGFSAFMSEPHTQDNGVYHVKDLYGYGCAAVVQVNGGYSQHGLPPGHFDNASTLLNVYGQYGTRAQVNRDQLGPSCAPCAHENTPPNYKVLVSNITAKGYPKPSNRTSCYFWIRWKGCPFG
eukprot:m.268347 g.268347  ORF g.268347 m.268347 type:complete len:179 (-) comp36347_c0_seq1:65-601(-)